MIKKAIFCVVPGLLTALCVTEAKTVGLIVACLWGGSFLLVGLLMILYLFVWHRET